MKIMTLDSYPLLKIIIFHAAGIIIEPRYNVHVTMLLLQQMTCYTDSHIIGALDECTTIQPKETILMPLTTVTNSHRDTWLCNGVNGDYPTLILLPKSGVSAAHFINTSV